MSDDDGESEEAETTEEPQRRSPGGGEDGTVPRVELSMRELSVSVTGRSDDDLETVEGSAVSLMSFLVAEADEREDGPDEYGLS